MTALTIGEKVRRLRNAKRMSREDFARLVGVDYTTASRYEKPEFNPSVAKLHLIAHVLEVRRGYLVGDEIPEFRDRAPEYVAAHESLRLFLEKKALPESKRKSHRYWRAIDLPAAPTTVKGWQDIEEFLAAIGGAKA